MISTSIPVGKASLHIDDDRCQACRHCLAQRVCKVKAIVRIDHDESPFIDVHRCHAWLMSSTSTLTGLSSGDEAVDCRPPRAAALVLNMSLTL